MSVSNKIDELIEEFKKSGSQSDEKKTDINSEETIIVKIYKVKKIKSVEFSDRIDKTAHSLMGYGGRTICPKCQGSGSV